jgi:methylenetetrahydrofolate dehydrogenase (NADP+)/methenyltetrahydrofolate cyclohydrolase
LTARILNGNAIRDQIYGELQSQIAELRAAGVRPGLAAVLVGENPASHLYVKSKIAACEKLGLFSEMIRPPATLSTEEMLRVVEELNARDGCSCRCPSRWTPKKSWKRWTRRKTWTVFIR